MLAMRMQNEWRYERQKKMLSHNCTRLDPNVALNFPKTPRFNVKIRQE